MKVLSRMMNMTELRTMSANQRKKRTEKLLNLHGTGAQQALNSLRAGQDKIAIGILKQLRTFAIEIKALLELDQPAIGRIRELLDDFLNYGKAFEAAIKKGDISGAKTVSRWITNNDEELVNLLFN